MIAVATTSATTVTAYRWEGGMLVAAEPAAHARSDKRTASATAPTGPAIGATAGPSALPTLVFLAGV